MVQRQDRQLQYVYVMSIPRFYLVLRANGVNR
jgi:hypothetical protein